MHCQYIYFNMTYRKIQNVVCRYLMYYHASHNWIMMVDSCLHFVHICVLCVHVCVHVYCRCVCVLYVYCRCMCVLYVCLPLC